MDLIVHSGSPGSQVRLCFAVCPKGFYEASPNTTACTRCPLHAFCPGGERVESPTTRGNPISCGSNLVTRNTGARTQADCVAPRGYAMTSPTTATPCGPSEYAPHFNRLARCLKCQSGLQEPPNANFTASQRESKRAVCSECYHPDDMQAHSQHTLASQIVHTRLNILPIHWQQTQQQTKQCVAPMLPPQESAGWH